MPRHDDIMSQPYYSSLLDACVDLIRMRNIIRDMHAAHLEIPESIRFHLHRLTLYVDQRLDKRPHFHTVRDDRTRWRHVWKWPKRYGDDERLPRWVPVDRDGKWVRLAPRRATALARQRRNT